VAKSEQQTLAQHHATMSPSFTERYGHVLKLAPTPRHTTTVCGTACWTILLAGSFALFASWFGRLLDRQLARYARWIVQWVLDVSLGSHGGPLIALGGFFHMSLMVLSIRSVVRSTT